MPFDEFIHAHVLRLYRVFKSEAEAICRNLEAGVGRDLQFIRINGTVLGGLVGITLHELIRLIWR